MSSLEISNNKLIQKNQNNKSNFRKRLVPGIALILLAVFFYIIPVFYFNFFLVVILFFFLIGGGLEINRNRKRIDTKKRNIVQKVFSIHFCLSLTLLALLGLGILGGNGQYWFVSTVIIVGIACDLAAYSTGNIWKKFWRTHKLAPVISPNKTVEGAVASFIVSPVLSWLLGTRLLFLDWYIAIGLGFVIALFAIIGDLFESYYKRTMGIKDSGAFFGGHGGFLDRIDGHQGAVYGVVVVIILVSLMG